MTILQVQVQPHLPNVMIPISRSPGGKLRSLHNGNHGRSSPSLLRQEVVIQGSASEPPVTLLHRVRTDSNGAQHHPPTVLDRQLNPTALSRSTSSSRSTRSRYSILVAPIILLLSVCVVIYTLSLWLSKRVIFSNGTTLYNIGLPHSLTQAEVLSGLLNEYFAANDSSTQHVTVLYQLVLLYCLLFLAKQTFSIPGSALLNIIGGACLPHMYSFPLVTLLTTVGASSCYLMSSILGESFVLLLFSRDKITQLQTQIQKSQTSGNLFYFLLSARLMPMSPQFLINLISPIVHVPFLYFCSTCLIGLAPYCFITTGIGSTLAEIARKKSLLVLDGDGHAVDQLPTITKILDTPTLIKLSLFAVVALIPTCINHYQSRQQRKHSDDTQTSTGHVTENTQLLSCVTSETDDEDVEIQQRTLTEHHSMLSDIKHQ